MSWWHRFIPAIKKSAEIADEQSDRAMELQTENRLLRDRVTYLEKSLAEAIENERRTYQMQINIDFQLSHGFAPYPNAPFIPPGKQRTRPTQDPLGEVINASRYAGVARQQSIEEFLRQVDADDAEEAAA